MDRPRRRDILHIGQITAPHGVRGEVRVRSLSDAQDRFSGLEHCWLVSPDERSRRQVRVTLSRGSGRMPLVKLEGVDSREQAEALRGSFLSVSREDSMPLEPDTYFIADLEGCRVFHEDGAYIGVLEEVVETAAHDVYRVRREHKKNLLIPAVRAVIRSVDVDEGCIRVRLPDGLLEVYD